MLRPKAVRLLNVLLRRGSVSLPNSDQPLEIGETPEGVPVVGFRMTKRTLGSDAPPEEFIMVYDITLNDFLALAERMSDDDLFIMGAEVALTNMANERSERREQWVQAHREA